MCGVAGETIEIKNDVVYIDGVKQELPALFRNVLHRYYQCADT